MALNIEIDEQEGENLYRLILNFLFWLFVISLWSECQGETQCRRFTRHSGADRPIAA